jgi:hypothetical protein
MAMQHPRMFSAVARAIALCERARDAMATATDLYAEKRRLHDRLAELLGRGHYLTRAIRATLRDSRKRH